MDGAAFGRMIVSASAAIELKKQKINELNVFPVPDGDTGTNMSMTLAAAATDLKKRSPDSLTKAFCAARAETRASFYRFCSGAFPSPSRGSWKQAARTLRML